MFVCLNVYTHLAVKSDRDLDSHTAFSHINVHNQRKSGVKKNSHSNKDVDVVIIDNRVPFSSPVSDHDIMLTEAQCHAVTAAWDDLIEWIGRQREGSPERPKSIFPLISSGFVHLDWICVSPLSKHNGTKWHFTFGVSAIKRKGEKSIFENLDSCGSLWK